MENKFEKAINKTNELIDEFERLDSSLKDIADKMRYVLNKLGSYPNKRVRHLAFHAKKKRTRKKNINRMMN